MNESMIERWNERVRRQDRVYHLGDFSFGTREQTVEVLSRLRGQLHIIRGNHDSTLDSAVKDDRVAKKIRSYDLYKEIKVHFSLGYPTDDKPRAQRIVLMHFPLLSWHHAHRGAWHLFGHCHGNLKVTNGPMLDVGVDTHDFRPYSLDEVRELLSEREWQPVDHHDKDRPEL